MRMCMISATLCLSFLCRTEQLSARQAAVSDTKRQLIELWESNYGRADALRTKRIHTYYATRNGKPEAITQIDRLNYNLKFPFHTHGFVSERYKDGNVSERYDELTIVNDAYEAVLMRSKNHKDAWVLREFKATSSANPSLGTFRNLACPWLLCSNIFLPEWVAESTFAIARADTLDGGITRVHFTDTGDNRPVRSGWLDVEMGRRGLIHGYEFNIKTKVVEGKEIGHYEYGSIDGKPVLTSRAIQRPLMVSTKYGESSSRESDEYVTVFDVPSDDEFYLSYYGIPEPGGAKLVKSFPIYLRLLVGAFACMAITIGIRNRDRLRFLFTRR